MRLSSENKIAGDNMSPAKFDSTLCASLRGYGSVVQLIGSADGIVMDRHLTAGAHHAGHGGPSAGGDTTVGLDRVFHSLNRVDAEAQIRTADRYVGDGERGRGDEHHAIQINGVTIRRRDHGH